MIMGNRILIGIIMLIAGFSCDGFTQEMLPDTICEGIGLRVYFVNGWPNSTYIWAIEGGIITPPGNTDTITVDWTGVPPGVYTISVTEQTENGCSGDLYSNQVYIMASPDIQFQLCTQVTTRDTRPFALKGAIPLNGTYSGAGIQAGIFYPQQVPPGQDTVIVNYYYVTVNGCSGSAFQVLSILPSTNHTCGNPFTDLRDNKVYETIMMGTKCWMTSNLNYGNQISGSEFQRDNCIPEKYCYNGLGSNCSSFGALYQWDELMEYNENEMVQGLCPPGWHIPGETDWQDLISLFQDAAHAGTALKPTGTSGFNALLKGFYLNALTWKYGVGDTQLNSTLFWSSTPSGSEKTFAHGLNTVVTKSSFTTSISSYSSSRANAFSVRCIKDE